MKLSENTINVLKNYSTINNTILVRPGSELQTMAIPSQAIFAKATVEEVFPQQFAIYELSTLLGALSLFDQPDIEFEEKKMIITSGRQRIDYAFAEPSMVVAPPDREFKFATPEIEFDLSREEYIHLVRAASVFKLPQIKVSCAGDKIVVKAVDNNNPSSHLYGVEVGSSPHTFDMILDVANIIRLIPKDYKVMINSAGISKFAADNIVYYVVCEYNSKFTKG